VRWTQVRWWRSAPEPEEADGAEEATVAATATVATATLATVGAKVATWAAAAAVMATPTDAQVRAGAGRRGSRGGAWRATPPQAARPCGRAQAAWAPGGCRRPQRVPVPAATSPQLMGPPTVDAMWQHVGAEPWPLHRRTSRTMASGTTASGANGTSRTMASGSSKHSRHLFCSSPVPPRVEGCAKPILACLYPRGDGTEMSLRARVKMKEGQAARTPALAWRLGGL